MKALREEVTGEGTAVKMMEVNRRSSARLPAIEREPPFPMHDAYLFQIFHDLNAARSHNGFSYNPVSYLELDAYQRLTGRVLTPWVVRMLMQMDRIFLTASVKGQALKADRKKH